MQSEFTAIIECDEDWFIAYCAEAISLILEDCREDALRGIPQNAIRETITVGV